MAFVQHTQLADTVSAQSKDNAERPPGAPAKAVAGLELSMLLGQPHVTTIDKQMWATAALIAGLRTASHEERREEQDRGPVNNAIVDIQGVIGELVALAHFSKHLGQWSVRPFLLDWSGGGSAQAGARADIELSLEEASVTVNKVVARANGPTTVVRPELKELIEAKCHLDVTKDVAEEHKIKLKRDFAVNHQAMVDSHGIGAKHMLPIIAAPGRSLAVIGRSILVSDVLCWQPTDYGYKKAVALALPLTSASPTFWQAEWRQIQRQLHASSQCLDLHTLMSVHQGAIVMFPELQARQSFDLVGQTLAETIRLCLPVARKCLRLSQEQIGHSRAEPNAAGAGRRQAESNAATPGSGKESDVTHATSDSPAA